MTDDEEKKAWQKLNNRTLKSGPFLLRVSEYGFNDRFALEAMNTEAMEPECRVTVNLVDEPLGRFEFHVRFETRKHAGQVIDALIEEGIAVPTGKIVSAGYVERYAEVWRLVTEG